MNSRFIKGGLVLVFALQISPCQADWAQRGRLLKDYKDSRVTLSGNVLRCNRTNSNIEPGKFCHWERNGNGWCIQMGPDGRLMTESPDEKLVLHCDTNWEDHLEDVLFKQEYLGESMEPSK